MAQDHDLEFLELTRSQAQRGDRKYTPKEQVQQRWNQVNASLTRTHHESRLYGRGRGADARRLCAPDGFTYPTGRLHPETERQRCFK